MNENGMVAGCKCNECNGTDDVLVLLPYAMMSELYPTRYTNVCCMDDVKVVLCQKCMMLIASSSLVRSVFQKLSRLGAHNAQKLN